MSEENEECHMARWKRRHNMATLQVNIPKELKERFDAVVPKGSLSDVVRKLVAEYVVRQELKNK